MENKMQLFSNIQIVNFKKDINSLILKWILPEI